MPVLRDQVIRGGAYMAMRQAVGIAISLGGIFLLTRRIGPTNYGVFAASQSFLSWVVAVSECGIGVFLVKAPQIEGNESDFHQAFSLLLVQSGIGMLLAFAAIPLLVSWVKIEGLGPALAAMLSGLWLVHIIRVWTARLESRLEYKEVARIELLGQIGYYGAALPAAFMGAGFWAPVIGWWVQQLAQISISLGGGYRPRLCWNGARVRTMLRFGASYSASVWILQLRSFVNPLIVGRFLGASAVGQVALALRIVESLGFAKLATARISIAALARLEGDGARLARTITEGMVLQLMAVGPLLLSFALVAPIAIPLAFGTAWSGALTVYPFMAMSFLVSAMFLLHVSALTIAHRNGRVAIVNAVNVLVFVAVAAVAIPRFALLGFGIAELATLPTYWLLHAYTRRLAPETEYVHAFVWLISFSIPMLLVADAPWVMVLTLLPLVWPNTRRELQQLVSLVRAKGRALP